MSIITKVDVIPFTFKVHDLGLGSHRTMGVSNLSYQKGGTLEVMRYAIRIITNDGVEGHYVTHWVGTQLNTPLVCTPQLHRKMVMSELTPKVAKMLLMPNSAEPVSGLTLVKQLSSPLLFLMTEKASLK